MIKKLQFFPTFTPSTVIFPLCGEQGKIGVHFKVPDNFRHIFSQKIPNKIRSSIMCHFKKTIGTVNLNTVLESQHMHLIPQKQNAIHNHFDVIVKGLMHIWH